MRRGEVWTASAGGDYTGKPRPVVIVQDDAFPATASVAICAFTSDPTEAPLFRIEIAPSETNGLRSVSRLMVDKIAAVPRVRLGQRIGALSDEDLLRLNRALLVFLGLATPARAA
jgi:mRNA interferase MazF